MNLQDLRNRIDKVDKEILQKFGERFELCRKIPKRKKELEDAQREKTLLDQWQKLGKHFSLSNMFISLLLDLTLDESKRIQSKSLKWSQLFSFNIWNRLKKKIHRQSSRYFREKDIWFANIGHNIGFEQNGKGDNFRRPIIIIKKFNQEIFWAIPLTSTKKQGQYYIPIESSGKSCTAIISQIRLLDARRLQNKIGFLSRAEYESITNALSILLHENLAPTQNGKGRVQKDVS